MLALALSGCAVSPETREGRNLADTVKIEGYRRLSEQHKAETTLLYFVGQPGVDLTRAVSARDWSPQPPPTNLPNAGAYKSVVESSVNIDKNICHVVVSTLRSGFESAAIELTKQEQRDIAEGRLVYVQVACFCARAP